MNRTTELPRWRTVAMAMVGGFVAGATFLIAAPDGMVSAQGDGCTPTDPYGQNTQTIEEVLQQTSYGCYPDTTLPPETTQPPVTTLPPDTTMPPETTQPPMTTLPPETTQPPITTLPPATPTPTPTPSVAAAAPTTVAPVVPASPTLPATGQNDVELVTAAGALVALLAGVWLVRVSGNRRTRPVA